ncbi:hypothetical protein OTK49_00950 [Vibrio coralliirubri]|uniref:hypothetical protein n=1 Tax=Vibrio coralliirubri TaxID=1516159 RepID=UPI002284AA2F|nr:hypothetical protein [Vibrio coralliirubri]MCY9861099.1 hypothetical protein [Vibrio coralliirubri]
MSVNKILSKHDVFDFMINGSLESARFIKNPETDAQVVIEVFEVDYDLQWQEVWENERSGVLSFPLRSTDTYLHVSDDATSEDYQEE